MASIESIGNNRKYSLKSPKVDMTPMVDLGFLLITFFIFTTTATLPSGLKLVTPIPDFSNPIKVKCSKTISLLAEQGGRVGWVECVNGQEQPPIYYSLYGSKEIRHNLLRKKADMAAIFNDEQELFVIIRPDSSASYQEVIDVLDELEICEVKRYSLVDQ